MTVMDRRGHKLKLTAVAALVVLALTGFSTGRGHGSSSHGGSDGGGCSSAGQDHDSSSSTSGSTSSGSSGSTYDDDDYDDTYDDTYDDGSSGSSSSDSTSELATVKLVSCATKDRPYATVEVTNPNELTYDFELSVYFMDDNDLTIEGVHPTVSVPANSTKSVQVKFGGGEPGEVLDHCEVDPTVLPEI